jgi:hypothetical protein
VSQLSYAVDVNNIHIWRNENEEKDGPFLLISYTNHALDQFLLEITKRVPGLKEKEFTFHCSNKCTVL